MTQPQTYQQLLAEQYEDSARNRLVFQTAEAGDEDEDVEYDALGRMSQGVGYELEDKTGYGKFAGNRHSVEDLIKPAIFEDKGKVSVRYNKDVRLSVFNIDSRFRAYATPGISTIRQPAANTSYISPVLSTAVSSASNFVFRSSKQIKNAMSVTLTSLEMPNTFFNFLESRGNTSFRIRTSETPTADSGDWYIIKIPDGYYHNSQKLIDTINSVIQSAIPEDVPFSISSLVLTYDEPFCRISYGSSSIRYDFDFTTSPFLYSTYVTTGSSLNTPVFETLGRMLGFPDVVLNSSTNVYYNVDFTGGKAIVSKYSVDVDPDHYIYLKINDYSTIVPQSINDTYYTVFAKIPITITKGLMIVDNYNTNSTTKEYRFLQPTNIQQLEIQLLDMTGTQLIFQGNFSMTLEIEEVISHGLYEKLREL